MLAITTGLDLSKYDDKFFMVIDKLIQIKYGKEVAELVYFYLYERVNPDQSINVIKDSDGNEITLKTYSDLWSIVLKLNPDIEKTKK